MLRISVCLDEESIAYLSFVCVGQQHDVWSADAVKFANC